jgi:hypothetical protein
MLFRYCDRGTGLSVVVVVAAAELVVQTEV